MMTEERALIFTGLGSLVWVVLFGGAALTLVVYLYRTERKLVRPRAGWLLVALRVAAALVVLLMFLEPVISITRTLARKSVLLVLVDGSRSMQVPDTTQSGGRRLVLAHALGKRLTPDLAPSPLSSSAEELDLSARALARLLIDCRSLSDSLSLQGASAGPLAARFDGLSSRLGVWQESTDGLVARLGKDKVPGLSAELELSLSRTLVRLDQEVALPARQVRAEMDSAEFRARLTVTRMDRVTAQLGRAHEVLRDASAQLAALGDAHNDLLASRASAEVAPELQKLSSTPRLQLAEQLLSECAPALAERYDVQLRAFAQRLSKPLPMPSPDQPLNILQPKPSTVPANASAEPSTPLGENFTDIGSSLRSALAEAGDRKLAAVVLVTDGRANRGDDPISLVPELARRHVPVFAVAVGAELPPQDLAIVNVEAPDVIYESDQATLSVVLAATGFDGRSVDVTLSEADKEIEKKTVRLSDAQPRQIVSFTYTPADVGEHTCRVSVEPLAGELTADNNQAQIVLRVVKDRSRVLLVDGGPRWEYRYLKNALLRDKKVDLTYVLFDPTAVSGDESARARREFPDSRDKMFAYDVVLLGDVSPTDLSPADLTLVESFVADRGGTLVVMAGRRDMPARFLGTALDRLLPAIPSNLVGGVTLKDGYRFAPAPEAADAEMMRLSPDPAENSKRWEELPDLYWYAPLERLKPGSTVLARHVDKTQTPGEELPEASRALVVQQGYGLGNVLFVGTDSTWRWRYKVADEYHHRFWGQVIRWATAGRLPVGTDTVRFGTDRGEYLDGQTVMVRARVLSQDSLPVTDAQVQAVLYAEKNPGPSPDLAQVSRTDLTYVAASGGRYEGSFPNVPPGAYAVKLLVKDYPQDLSNLAARFVVRDAPVRELAELSVNTPMLETLASRTDGRVLRLEQLPQLVSRLPNDPWVESSTRQVQLWDTFYLLIVFAGLVTLEWVVRKREGLV